MTYQKRSIIIDQMAIVTVASNFQFAKLNHMKLIEQFSKINQNTEQKVLAFDQI